MARRGEKQGDSSATATATPGTSSGSGGGTALQERPRKGVDSRRRGGGTGLMRSGMPASPWELMGRMSEELNQLFESIGGVGTAPAPAPTGVATPARTRGRAEAASVSPVLLIPQIEVLQRPDAMVVRIDLPGLTADEIDVSVEDGVLAITGERRQEQREDEGGFVRTEIVYGTFYRAIPLPEGADEDNIVATLHDGVLEVIVPVAEREASRRVEVRGTGGNGSDKSTQSTQSTQGTQGTQSTQSTQSKQSDRSDRSDRSDSNA